MKKLNAKNLNANPEVVVLGNSNLFVSLVAEAKEQINPLISAFDAVNGNKFHADDIPHLFKCCDALFRRISALSDLMNVGCFYIDVVSSSPDDSKPEV